MDDRLPYTTRRSLWIGGGLFLLLGTLTLLTSAATAKLDRAAEEAHFNLQAAELCDRIAKRMKDYEMLLRSAAGLFIASREVSRDEWHAYHQLLQPALYYPGLQGLGFAEWLTPGHVMPQEARIRAEGLAHYKVFPPGDRKAYAPVTYLEPMDWRNKRAIGYDMYSEPARRAAMDLARNTNMPALSAPVRLIQETDDTPQIGLLMYWPAMQQSSEGQPPRFIGFAYAAFRTADLMNAILDKDRPHFGLRIVDVDASPSDAVAYQSTSPTGPLKRTEELGVSGRIWRMEIYATPTYMARQSRHNAVTTQAVGLALSALIAMVLTTYLYQRENAALAERVRARELIQRETRFRRMIDTMPHGVFVVDHQGVIEHANQSLHRTFGHPAGSLIGRHLSVLLPEELRTQHQQHFAQYLLNPGDRLMGQGRELFGLAANGAMIPVEISLSPVRDNGHLSILAVVVDITPRRTAEEQLKQQAEALARSNHYKSEFLANVSHELRTPLNSILILSEQLHQNKGGRLSEREVLHARVIRQSGTELLALINDILDLSRIEAGRMELLKDHFAISSLSERLLEGLGPLADQKGLEFSVEIAADCPGMLFTDLQRLSQILRNLIQNAIKFTHKGGVQVQISRPTEPTRREEGFITFSVKDTGIGLPADKLDIIFDAFRQADGSTSRRFGGSGLGLTISKELAHLLGGYIEVNSQEGKGSIFTLCIPCGRDSSNTLLPSPDEAQPSAPHSDYRDQAVDERVAHAERHTNPVLIVDDDIRNIYAMSALLDELGFDSIPARHGEEALALVNQASFSLVFMDIAMPMMDGPTTIKALRAQGFTAPIVVVTAHAMKGDREQYLALGADDYLAKPVSRAATREILEKWVK